MSETASNEFQEARTKQEARNDARRIQIGVREARNNRTRAAMRWPFELMQNAHDAGPRNATELVDVEFIQKDDSLLVVHNGKPFDAQELAALLSGGSSKEFDDQETTGRFGTGFLSTHALSTRVDVAGILNTKRGLEEFCIELDRGGDENSIFTNIQEADQAIKDARSLSSDTDNHPTAHFTYYSADTKVVERGLDRLERTIPYLYSTCHKLGQISVQRRRSTLCSKRLRNLEEKKDGLLIKSTEVSISSDGITLQYTTLRIGTQDSSVGLLIVLKHNEGNQHEVVLPSDSPRIFVKFPISGTNLPMYVVLDGNFTPRQERDGIMMESDEELIAEALSTFPKLIAYAVNSRWINSHKLARISVPARPLGDDSKELSWWRGVVSEVASATAERPIVATRSGFLSCNGEPSASFLVPASAKDAQTPLDYDDLYRIADEITDLHLPLREIAEDWGNIVEYWDLTDLPVRLGLTELAGWVKDGHSTIDELPIKGDSFRWLADLFLIVARLPESVNRKPLIDWLIPDQNSRLRRTQDVRIEIDISDVIKDIACEMGIDLRARLVHRDLMQALAEPGYEPARGLIGEMLGQDYTENEAIEKVLQTLENKLPDGHQFSEVEDLSYLRAAASMAAYLASEDSTKRLRRCPLLTAEDKIVRLGNNLQVLAPVLHWKDTQRPYANLYRRNRIMSDRHFDGGPLNLSMEALIQRNIALPSPLYWAIRDLRGDLLRSMVTSDTDTSGLAISNQSFGQIAFLSSEVASRCGYDRDLAATLLDFVLNVAVKEDPHWIDTTSVSYSGSDKVLEFLIHRSTWPFELKIRSWVPLLVDEDENTFAPAPANETNLHELLDTAWLHDNSSAVFLLNRVFGFRQLTLMLESLDSDAEVEDGLVRLLQEPDLVKSAAANIDVVRLAVEDPEVRAFVQDRRRQSDVRNLNRDFGLAVQEAVKEAVESLGLDLHLVDSGYDYEVFPDNSSFSYRVGSYFLEVKATVSRDVRLTPKQAKTACDNSSRFVLCVVDLSDLPGARSKVDWRAEDVLCRAKMVANIGGYFRDIYEGIAGFTEADQLIRLRNEGLLRYGVSKDLWENGVSIEEWVESLR